MGSAIRIFIAFELPDDVIRRIVEVQRCLRSAGLTLRWVHSDNIHLTLRFLGEIETERVDGVVGAMQSAARGRPPLALTIQGLGVFPGARNPRVLWTGIGGQTDLLGALQRRLEESLVDQGFAKDNKPFKAHLTIARCKEAVDTRGLGQAMEACGRFEPLPFEAAEMVLIKSDLRPRGPVYTPLERAALVGFGGDDPI